MYIHQTECGGIMRAVLQFVPAPVPAPVNVPHQNSSVTLPTRTCRGAILPPQSKIKLLVNVRLGWGFARIVRES